MTLAIIMALTASFLWALTNHVDKFMISGIDESGSSIKTLLVFSTLVAGVALSPIWLIVSNFSVSISNISLICTVSAAFICILASYFYFKAIDKNNVSIIVVMSNLIPVFSYVLELVFFKENLTINQIIGSIIIILSAILISCDFKDKGSKDKWKALLLMTISSIAYAVYFFLFDIAIRNSSYNSCAFWYQIGLLILGIIFICIKKYRSAFINAIKTNGKKYFSLNITNEVLCLVANLLINFANLTIPLAMANVLMGVQGAFAFILGVIGVKLLPKYFTEDLSRKVVIQKIICIILSIIGLIVMFIR